MDLKTLQRLIDLALQHDQVGSYEETDQNGELVDNEEFISLYQDQLAEIQDDYRDHLEEVYKRLWNVEENQ